MGNGKKQHPKNGDEFADLLGDGGNGDSKAAGDAAKDATAAMAEEPQEQEPQAPAKARRKSAAAAAKAKARTGAKKPRGAKEASVATKTKPKAKAKAKAGTKGSAKAAAHRNGKAALDKPITNRNLKPGTKLVARYKGRTHRLVVIKDEKGIGYQLDGKKSLIFSSLSSAASAVIDRGHANGWKFWRVPLA